MRTVNLGAMKGFDVAAFVDASYLGKSLKRGSDKSQ
jgi:hypothetical protein